MAERPLLTIAVPTYNRHEELRNLHENFLLRLSNNVLSQLEVIVTDNSDAEIAYENAQYFEGTVVKHFMNNGNVGYAKNIVNCVRKATGRYLWITSDDDHIYEDKFDVFAGWLAERDHDLSSVFLPYQAENIDGSNTTVNTHGDWKVSRQTQLKEIVTGAADVPFILPSSCVLNLQDIDYGMLDRLEVEFENNDFIQVPIFLNIIGKRNVSFYDDFLLRYQLPLTVRFNFERMVTSMRSVISDIERVYPGTERQLVVRDNKRWMGWLLWHKAGVVQIAGVTETANIRLRKFFTPISVINTVLLLALRMPAFLVRKLLETHVIVKCLASSQRGSLPAYRRRVEKVKSLNELTDRGQEPDIA